MIKKKKLWEKLQGVIDKIVILVIFLCSFGVGVFGFSILFHLNPIKKEIITGYGIIIFICALPIVPIGILRDRIRLYEEETQEMENDIAENERQAEVLMNFAQKPEAIDIQLTQLRQKNICLKENLSDRPRIYKFFAKIFQYEER